MTQTAHNRPSERSQTSRRTVLKAGAHAAWAVPAVTIVTSAPAFAASGSNQCPNLSLRVHGTQFGGDDHDGRVVYNIRNKSKSATPVSISVSASSGGGQLTPRRPPGFVITQNSDTSWTVTGTARHGGTTLVLYFKGGSSGGQLSGVLSDSSGNTCGSTTYSVSY